MNVLVLYYSRNGHTRRTAETIAEVARAQDHTPVVKSVIEVNKGDVEQADVLFVGTWVHGFILFGVRPAGAEQWVPALPALDGKPVGTFCTYAFHPRRSLPILNDMLTARGATIVGQQAFQRSRLGRSTEPFVQEVLQSVSLSPA